MLIGKLIRIYKHSWISGAITLNALVVFIYLFTGQFFNIFTLKSLVPSLSIMFIFNMFLLWIYVIEKPIYFNEKILREFAENIKDIFWRVTPDLSKTIYV